MVWCNGLLLTFYFNFFLSSTFHQNICIFVWGNFCYTPDHRYTMPPVGTSISREVMPPPISKTLNDLDRCCDRSEQEIFHVWMLLYRFSNSFYCEKFSTANILCQKLLAPPPRLPKNVLPTRNKIHPPLGFIHCTAPTRIFSNHPTENLEINFIRGCLLNHTIKKHARIMKCPF